MQPAITDVRISRHGDQRCRERLGLPRRAVRRTALRAWLSGIDGGVDHGGRVVREWGGARWVFEILPCIVVLVTVLTGRDEGDDTIRGALRKIKLARRRDGRVMIRGRVVRDHERKVRRWEAEHGGRPGGV